MTIRTRLASAWEAITRKKWRTLVFSALVALDEQYDRCEAMLKDHCRTLRSHRTCILELQMQNKLLTDRVEKLERLVMPVRGERGRFVRTKP